MIDKKIILIIIVLKVAITYGSRIIGGRPARPGECPYQVSLRKTYNNELYCGGCIISDQFVLTACHCVYSNSENKFLSPSTIKVYAGELSSKYTSNTVSRYVIKIIPHPDWDKANYFNDIALVKVDEPFPFETNENIKPIALSSQFVYHAFCKVSGWGKTNTDDRISDVLQIAEVSMIDTQKCKEMYSKAQIIVDERSMSCAGHARGLTDACQGDSGGPLVCQDKLYGVVSTGKGCAQYKYPGIYANVPCFYNWIKENMEANTEHRKQPNDFFQNFLQLLQFFIFRY